ncbi:MAG TPA: GDP-L-fucose synthase [Caulobacteraceae bacterium]|jgi:GDP-L-fucose synthase
MAVETVFPLKGKRVWVAGHRGMVGSAIVRRLAREDCSVLTADRADLDLMRQDEVDRWLKKTRPDALFLAAARVGGIRANNSRPADFLYENLMIGGNVIEAAHRHGVAKLMVLGSSCIYPRLAPQPIPEEALLTGPLEPTNEGYAVAKIAALKLAQAYRRQHGDDFISAMPTNLYGPGDNFDLFEAHALPSLLRKAHEAKARGDRRLVMGGTGAPKREYLHVDDCADALVFLMKTYSGESQVNVGSGEDLSIRELTELVCEVVGFKGEIVSDLSIPDGMPRKLMSARRLREMGWAPRIELRTGLQETYRWFLANAVEPA